MSSEFKHGQRHSRYFMAPVWIALALCGMGVAFVLGGYLIADDWSRQDKTTLDAYKTASPSSALELAAEAVKHDRIEFGVYRDLLRATLAEQDARARSVAFRSIRDVLQYGGAFADDLKAELKGMAPQVFITTTTSKGSRQNCGTSEWRSSTGRLAIQRRSARARSLAMAPTLARTQRRSSLSCAAGAMRSAMRTPPAGRKTIPTTWRRPCIAPR